MDKLHLDEHISQQFNTDLDELKTQLLELGGLVEQQTVDALKAIVDADGELAEKVRLNEEEVDLREIKLDDSCTQVLARRHPAASDLRMVLAVARITRDLERMGDEADKIAKMAINLVEDGAAPRGYVELRHIGHLVHQMLVTALDAFARYDVDLAVSVAHEDTKVDQEYKSAMRELATYMMEDPRSISLVMNIIWALRSLERIGDHARNIAEHVIYLVRGVDLRHASLSEMEEKLKR